jgi:WhiB family redox-sensing transcriptional regulator
MAVRIYVDEVKIAPPQKEQWMDKAACLNQDLEKFFPSGGSKTTAAKAVCGRCDVKLKCLAWILQTEPPRKGRSGVFGGLGPTERENLAKKLKGLLQ